MGQIIIGLTVVFLWTFFYERTNYAPIKKTEASNSKQKS